MTKWYAMVVGLVLLLMGLDPWLPTGPEVMVMPLAGVVSIILGLIGIVMGVMEFKGKKKGDPEASTTPTAPSPTPPQTPPANG